jgi:SnoaL-like domain
MPDASAIANRYITAWNETNSDRRRGLLASLWTEDATYTDPLMHGEGLNQIDGLIDAVQRQFPDFRFALAGRVDGYGNQLRFSWELGPEGGESLIGGTDFAVLDGDRLKAVIGFLDKVPAGA